jgi:hypothetical protein
VLGLEAIDCLAQNILHIYPEFNTQEFKIVALRLIIPVTPIAVLE